MISKIATITVLTAGAIVCSAMTLAAFSLISSSFAILQLATALILLNAYGTSVWREKQLADGKQPPKVDESVWANVRKALITVGCNAIAATILANSAVIPGAIGILSPVIIGLAGFISWIFPLVITYYLIKIGLAWLRQSVDCLSRLCGWGHGLGPQAQMR